MTKIQIKYAKALFKEVAGAGTNEGYDELAIIKCRPIFKRKMEEVAITALLIIILLF